MSRFTLDLLRHVHFAGWGIPIVFGSIALARTGVSYRFGDTCHINHDKALQDYWGPLLAFATVSTILQFATLGYCIRVYIRSLLKEDTRSYNSSELPSYQGSVRTITARQAYRRVQKAIAVQWRGIVVVIIIIVNVVFLAIVFISMDNTVQAVMDNFAKAEPWLSCLVIHGGDKNACLDKAHGLTTPEPTLMGVLILLSPRQYEMITSPPQTAYNAKSPRTFVTSPSIDGDTIAALSPSSQQKDYFSSAPSEAKYTSPTLSFSTPRPPSSSSRLQGREWDPACTHAKPSNFYLQNGLDKR
ncbi:MAG: hypothetical protein LQ351_000534 [Letrouitia transgressa]|nr:MAG: hypothetical protein LQ351_000534 [Letrouitia transgressa]